MKRPAARSCILRIGVYPGAKLDQANPLPARHAISNLGIENNASRQQSRNLLEDDRLTVTFHGDNVLLVLFRTELAPRVEELATLVPHVADRARNR